MLALHWSPDLITARIVSSGLSGHQCFYDVSLGPGQRLAWRVLRRLKWHPQVGLSLSIHVLIKPWSAPVLRLQGYLEGPPFGRWVWCLERHPQGQRSGGVAPRKAPGDSAPVLARDETRLERHPDGGLDALALDGQQRAQSRLLLVSFLRTLGPRLWIPVRAKHTPYKLCKSLTCHSAHALGYLSGQNTPHLHSVQEYDVSLRPCLRVTVEHNTSFKDVQLYTCVTRPRVLQSLKYRGTQTDRHAADTINSASAWLLRLLILSLGCGRDIQQSHV